MKGIRNRPFLRAYLRMRASLRSVGLVRWVTVALTGACLASVTVTYGVLMGFVPVRSGSPMAFWLLNLDLVLLLVLGALAARKLAQLWVARHHSGAGSRLHLRFVALFSIVAVTPAILVAVFSAVFFEAGVETWFGSRIQTALVESQVIAEAYLKEHEQVITGQALAVANDLQRNWSVLANNPDTLQRFLTNQASVRGLTEAIIFSEGGKVAARAGYTLSLQFEEVPFWALDKAQKGEVAMLTGQSDDRVRALVKLDVYPPEYLFVGRFVDATVLQHLRRTKDAVNDYARLEQGRASLQVEFTLIFIAVALLVLFGAVWVGLVLATRLARPIADLIGAAAKISEGNLHVRVPEMAAGDDLAILSRTFNRMARRMAGQQARLLEANRQIDERREFSEAVLEGVSAGVLSTDADGCLVLANGSASALLKCDLDAVTGSRLTDLVPEFAGILAAAAASPDSTRQQEVTLQRDGQTMTFLVRVVEESLGSERQGQIITLDDITELQAAQRKAAWADVARRIAHEIKNPLTPIQLSAERLKRRYLKQITQDPEIFIQCTDTIIRHVSDIGHMVDEFSDFARMPAPQMQLANLNDVVLQAIFLQRTAFPAITFQSDMADPPVRLPCDVRQLGQTLTNLLKNAVEAIDSRTGPAESLPQGKVTVRVVPAESTVAIIIEDNGRGLPADRSRLTEPYVTTRAKGTGLGLAIVKKIMEDHGGSLVLEDAEGGGAKVTIVLPKPVGESRGSPLGAEPLAEQRENTVDHGA